MLSLLIQIIIIYLLYNKYFILSMISFDGRNYEHIDVYPDLKNILLMKIFFLKYNYHSLILMNNRICVGNVRYFDFNDEYTEDIVT